MIKRLVIFFYILSLFLVFGDEFSVDKIINPTLNNSRISDNAALFSANEIAKIEQLIDSIDEKSKCEIALVTVNNLGGKDIFSVSQEIFDKWGIGKKGLDSGVLIVISIEDREFRTHTGYGVEGDLPDGLLLKMQEQIAIPHIKKGDYYTGILYYIAEIGAILENSDLAEKYISNIPEKKENKLIVFLIFLAGGLSTIFFSTKNAIRGYKEYLSLKKKKYSYSEILDLSTGKINTARYTASLFFLTLGFLVLGIPFSDSKNLSIIFDFSMLAFVSLLLFFVFSIVRVSAVKGSIVKRWRNDPRKCDKCDGQMTKLNEKMDNDLLSLNQSKEENIRSLDYDVWLCKNCNNKTIEKYRGRMYHLYSTCSKCKSLSLKRTGSKVIVHPTYDSTGTRENYSTCVICGFKKTETSTIPRYERSTTGSSGGFSGSGGSGGSRSFGGGRSGGGGATSGW